MSFASLRGIRLACVTELYVIAATCGMHVAFRDEPSRADMLLSLTFSLLVVFSVVADSKIVGRQMPSIGHFLVLCSWPVAVPGYLVWTHRWKGLALVVVFAFTLWLVYYGTAIGSYTLRLLAAVGEP